MHDFHVGIEHITRVEGHGNIVIDVKDGKIKELRMEIVESPRFFEAMALGRSYREVAPILLHVFVEYALLLIPLHRLRPLNQHLALHHLNRQ